MIGNHSGACASPAPLEDSTMRRQVRPESGSERIIVKCGCARDGEKTLHRDRNWLDDGIEHVDSADACVQELSHRAEAKLVEESEQFINLGVQPAVVAESIPPRHWWPRLPWVELPGMEVEHHRLLLAQVDPTNAPTEERIREQSKQASATDREIRAEDASRPNRKLGQAAGAISPDLVRKSQGVRLSVAIVVNRIQA